MLNQGYKVYCIDNLSTSYPSNVRELSQHSGFELIEHDVSNPLPRSLPKSVYHLACPASPPKYAEAPLETLKTCFNGTYNVLEFAKDAGVQVLFTSTSEIYGDPSEHPQKESYLGNTNCFGPRACYDEGKRVGETLCYEFQKINHRPVKIVRIFNTYGPRMDPYDGRVVSNFIVQALKGKSLTVYGSGEQTRSLCYVDDMVRGLMACMETKAVLNSPVNLGNPHELRVLDIAQHVQNIISTSVGVYHLSLPKDDPQQRCPDISLASSILDWKPKVGLMEGLTKTIEYFSKYIAVEKASANQ